MTSWQAGKSWHSRRREPEDTQGFEGWDDQTVKRNCPSFNPYDGVGLFHEQLHLFHHLQCYSRYYCYFPTFLCLCLMSLVTGSTSLNETITVYLRSIITDSRRGLKSDPENEASWEGNSLFTREIHSGCVGAQNGSNITLPNLSVCQRR